MFHALSDKQIIEREKFLPLLAEAGNFEVLATMIAQKPSSNLSYDRVSLSDQNKLGDTFLHTFAYKHNLVDLFHEIKKQTEGYQWAVKIERSSLTNCLEKQNNKGYTFLAVALNNAENKDMERNMIETIKQMTEIFGKLVVDTLCKKTDKGGNSLLHQAVRICMTEFVPFIFPKTIKAYEIFNKEGYNPLHLAVQRREYEMVKCILQDKDFNVNIAMKNGETALHLAAQLGDAHILGELIRQGGDLSWKDEDGHTPLHDCLQQVYFESADIEEQCSKFIHIWDMVVEKAVRWWCWKFKEKEEPAHGSEEYLKLQRKAVYYLRSCLKNEDGLSVLQFAADRGLTKCVQTMLSTKDVFVIQTNAEIKNKKTQELEHKTVYEIDVTNLCPEYFVQKSSIYSKEAQEEKSKTQKKELQKWTTMTNETSTTTTQEDLKREEENSDQKDMKFQNDHGIISFLDTLSAVKPPNKAGKILESTPMRSLAQLEWRVTQKVHLLWMFMHIGLMTWVTIEINTSWHNYKVWSPKFMVLGAFILLYATIMATSHFLVKIVRRRSNRKQAEWSVKKSIKKYQKDDKRILDWILSIPLMGLGQSVFLIEILFAGFAWTLFILKIINLDITEHIWIKGLFLLFGWLILLFPLTSFSPIYKLISVLRYIVIKDMFPWMVIYIIISIGFSLAITLQFKDLPDSSSCEDLSRFLNKTEHTFFELVVMTSGLDTDLKHVRSLACLFEDNAKNVTVILLLITTYAVISAVVLLNMLIAIMSNTVTEAQQDKGWRQYQVCNNRLSQKTSSKIAQ